MDVASLGLSIDSSDAKKAKGDLLQFSNAARVAERAASGLSSASGKFSSAEIKAMASAMGNVERTSIAAARALAAESLAAQKAAASTKAYNAAANQNVAGMVKTHNTANLAAQGFDIVTTAAGGMSAGLIGMQQGLQVAQVAMTTTDGFAKTLGASFLAMLSPVTFLAIGLTTLAAVGIQSVEWAKTGAAALRAFAGVLDEIAPYAVAAAASMALLYAPALIGGIVQVIALLGRMAAAALAVGVAFAAANPATAFILGITAAIAAANVFRDELANIFGRDIVGDAADAVNKIIGTFVGGYRGIKAAWEILPSALGDIVYSTANAVIAGVENMVNRVSSRINEYIAQIESALKKLPFGIGDTISLGRISANVDFGRITNPYAGMANQAQDTISNAVSSAQNTDYVGGFASAVAKGASAAADKVKELASWMTTVDEKGKKKSGGKTEAEHYADIVDGANRRIASLKAEQAALGLTEVEALKLKYATDLLNEAQQKGITLTAAQKSELMGLAGQMASTENATKKARESMEFNKSTLGGFINDLRNGLRNGESFWTSFGDAALSVLDRITDRLLNQVLDAVFQVSNAGSSSGGGLLSSLFGGLFGGGSSFAALPMTGPVPLARPFSTGGYTGNASAKAVAGVVHGGEYVFSKKATDRIGVGNLEAMHRSAKGYAVGGYVGATATSAPANGNVQSSGQSVIMVQLSPELVGQIMQQAQNQTVKIVQQNEKNKQNLQQNGQAQNG